MNVRMIVFVFAFFVFLLTERLLGPLGSAALLAAVFGAAEVVRRVNRRLVRRRTHRRRRLVGLSR